MFFFFFQYIFADAFLSPWPKKQKEKENQMVL